MNGDTERAFRRAGEILRKDSALTPLECAELETLFEQVNSTQYISLMKDPRHHRALRQYDHRVRLVTRLILAMMAVLFVASVLAGVFASLHR